MAPSLYLKAEGRKTLRYNINILSICLHGRMSRFWLRSPAILTLSLPMQEAEAFGLADSTAVCTRDCDMKMSTSLQAPSVRPRSPQHCFFQQLPIKWPFAPFTLALCLELPALVTWNRPHERKLLFSIYSHLLAQTLTNDMGDTHLLGCWSSGTFSHNVIWWWLASQTSSQKCTQSTIRSKHIKSESLMHTTRNYKITKDQTGYIFETFLVSNQSICKIKAQCFCVLWRCI